MRMHRPLLIITLVLAAVVTPGCFTKKDPAPTLMLAKILTSSHLNPNADGEPSPIIVRLYELRSIGKFQNSDFFSLFDDETNTLANDLVVREEFRFNPEEAKTLNRELNPATRYIGISAAFRDLEEAKWRAVLEITEHQQNTYTILLGRSDISVTETGPADE